MLTQRAHQTIDWRHEHRWSLQILGQAVLANRRGLITIVPVVREFVLLT